MKFDFPKPKEICTDPSCPFHGTLSVRGRTFKGVVTSHKMHKTVVVEWERRRFVKKYQRYEKRRSKVTAHNPDCIKARENQKVIIAETRPLSKTKNFVVVQVLA